MPPAKLRVLLADDHEETLREVAALLERDFELVGAVHDGAALVEAGTRLKPDVVIADLKMPKLNGLEAARSLLTTGVCRNVVLLTMHADKERARRALNTGIRGYVLKVDAGEDLIPAIQKVADGGTFLSSAIASKLAG